MIKKIITVSPRGFCAGVTRSIKAVEDTIDIFGTSIYIKHAIVHNKTVIKDLEDKGAIVVENVNEIPRGAVALFSAHGSPPEHFEQAKKRKIKVIDATCPLVTKVHFEMIKAIQAGQQPIYIGHQGHAEAEGVVGESKVEKVPIVETVEDVENLELKLKDGQEIIILTQTTFNVGKIKKVIKAIKNKFENVIEPADKDICYATTNRQDAIAELAKIAELVLVVGSKISSNSNRLVEVVKENGSKAKLLDSVEEIKEDWLNGVQIVGLSAGASAPEYKVQEIIDYFVKKGAKQENLTGVEENMKFNEPIELKKARKEKLLKIEINKGKFEIDSNLIENTIQETFKKLQELNKTTANQDVEISVAVVGEEEIRKINKQWRKKDEETDVLSFCYENTVEKLEGEIILCLNVIKDNAKKDGNKTEEELSKNVIHSILHIVGYEHGDQMFKLQAEISKDK
jgi:4-hydroxy-3-methylbut-2-enyl diphosphate reductase